MDHLNVFNINRIEQNRVIYETLGRMVNDPIAVSYTSMPFNLNPKLRDTFIILLRISTYMRETINPVVTGKC